MEVNLGGGRVSLLMKLLSWNVRGLGSCAKRKRVKEVILKATPDIVMLQETKFECLDTLSIRDIWDSRFKEWECFPSLGASGGMLLIWDTRFASKIDSFHGNFSVSVLLEIKGRGSWWFTSVYGPNCPRQRSFFWEELGFLFGFCGPNWCLGGDFNAIRSPDEKLGGSSLTASMRGFDSFIRECFLRDIPLSNARFTWSASRIHTVASRLDRFLFTNSWEDAFPDLVQETLYRPVSDHFPVVLESCKLRWGPTPFRFENMWLGHHSFLPLVKEIWNSSSVEGWEGFKIMRKLKTLKENLKEWNKSIFGDIYVKKEELLKEIHSLDRLELDNFLTEDNRVRRHKLRIELNEILLREETSRRQKMRIQWARDGDANSKLFHRMASGRRRKSLIKELELENGCVVRDVEVIASEITRFYADLFAEDMPHRPFFEDLEWCPISPEKACSLERPFEEEEIRKAVFALGKDKTPGPDGFSLAFFQDCWDIVKPDLLKVFAEFFVNGKVGTSMNSTFISLVPKKDRSVKVKDFRPISLVSSVYKIITKVLASRLSEVISDTISENQSAFIPGRQILDAALIANEVVDDVKSLKKKGLVFKLDFEKAYDRVNWGFLDKVMDRKGFGERWRKWISGCLSSCTFAVIVNGEPKSWFKGERGVRQGDPLSPFLFTIVVDVLSRLVSRAVSNGLVKGLSVGSEGILISHLQFADDTILFLEPDAESFVNVLSLLRFFEIASGLKINLSKSGLAGINVDSQVLTAFALSAGCQSLHWPLVYLGIPLGGNPRALSFWDPVVSKISKRLDNWKGAFFSLGGRITLVQSCLSSIPLYFLSLFRIPVAVAKKIERIMRDFLWSGSENTVKDHLVSWEICCRPKKEGGLGLGNLVSKNVALAGKWLWRFPSHSSSLWHKIIRSKYGMHLNGWDTISASKASHACPWKFITQGLPSFSSFLSFRLGDGQRIRFWEDKWVGNVPLLEACPRLFRLSSLHNTPVCQFYSFLNRSWNFHFFRNLLDREVSELQFLLSVLDSTHLSSEVDKRIWTLDPSGVFSCKSYFQFLTHSPNRVYFLLDKLIWKSKTPVKVKSFVWTAVLNKINTNDMLQKRRPLTALSPNWCIMCRSTSESGDHLFLHCSTATLIWNKLFGIFGESWACPLSLNQFLAMNFRGFGCRKEARTLWLCLVFAILWCLWLERNARIFQDSFATLDCIWDRIVVLASLWCSAHGCFRGVSLSDMQRDLPALLYGVNT